MSAISDEGKMINLIEEELTPFLKEFGYFKKIR